MKSKKTRIEVGKWRLTKQIKLLKMFTMNNLLLVFFVFCTSAVNANSQTQAKWEFEVFLDKKNIGYHGFTVRDDGETQKVEMEARFDVKLLFVNVFKYRHRNEEVWEGDCLASINSETESNGKDFSVVGELSGDEFQLQTQALETRLPSCVMTFAYWNPDFLLADALLNSQTGEYESVEISREAEEVLTIDGQNIPAIRYSIYGAASPITLWYSADDQRWLALESEVRGGRVLRYQPISLPDALPSAIARTEIGNEVAWGC